MKYCGAVFALVFGLLSTSSHAAVTQTTGAGSSVTVINRSATFDSITTWGIDLSAYSENLLSITTPSTSHVGFDAFGAGPATQLFYPSGGNNSYTAISTTDNVPIRGIEMLVGDGYGVGGQTYVYWEAWKAGSKVGSGTLATTRGTIVGWNDPNGFDQLRVGASNLVGYNAFGQAQAIAIDNVNVQTALIQPAAIPTLSQWGIIVLSSLIVLGAIFALRRQQT